MHWYPSQNVFFGHSQTLSSLLNTKEFLHFMHSPILLSKYVSFVHYVHNFPLKNGLDAGQAKHYIFLIS